MDAVIFFVFAALALAGALGVVLMRNPVHAALMLVVTLVSVAVFFLQKRRRPARGGADHRLRRRHRRAVPVRDHAARRRPRRLAARPASRFQRPAALALGVDPARRGPVPRRPHVGHRRQGAGRLDADPRRRAGDSATTSSASRASLFTDFLWPFEITAALLVLAVVGAVVLARRSGEKFEVTPEPDAREPGRRRADRRRGSPTPTTWCWRR